MSFVQKYDIIIVLDETHLVFAIFVLPKHRHFKSGLLTVAIASGAKSSKTNRDMMSEAQMLQEKGEYNGGIKW